ncbi:MAG: imidazole glycerol phosphate synthase subunit HisH [Gammaproteobacteria bacterium]|nr:imidazole glycerol phosphate synthase subunit HisH [Gammaproteobacteria bacterium]NIR97557.1 imidazole glycerol phosphate synthase subunit HisH [Gammaproteobacteria bacterium]NIT63195.1 imidazole glycerol phosphate synthase subunit HisH [Gammaproteobacteria bacterium]NIV20143.1 imidazole glycerol phosphate synthase subunit HisH [Gammaproteobacteria bacterium]NIX10479.1 imidazole glycerol phosphate synthase subunit HisH [Gammaproteobacteria bacterium]
MTTVAVIDYGMGNLRSVAKALEHAGEGARVCVTAEPQRIAAADRVVFPGQGAIGDAMAELSRLGLDRVLGQVMSEKPFLGICLGLEALLEHSEEDGGTPGFGVFPGAVRRFPVPLIDPHTGERLKVPHMGWNQVHQARGHPLWHGIADDSRFYFVHSYYVEPVAGTVAAGTTHYGVEFISAACRENIFAVQFHPEKSQHAGLALLGNFLRWDGQE